MREIIKDVFIFRGVISDSEQEYLESLYEDNKDDFYTPVLRSGRKMSIKMNCFGLHWNAKDYKYYSVRLDVDGEPVAPMPTKLVEMAKTFSLASFPYHNPEWDICIANHYHSGHSKLGMHSDNSESKKALQAGHPVVSFSVRGGCKFSIGPNRDDFKTIALGNSDVLVFGGESRLHYHGVSDVEPGRLNFTLRKM